MMIDGDDDGFEESGRLVQKMRVMSQKRFVMFFPTTSAIVGRSIL